MALQVAARALLGGTRGFRRPGVQFRVLRPASALFAASSLSRPNLFAASRVAVAMAVPMAVPPISVRCYSSSNPTPTRVRSHQLHVPPETVRHFQERIHSLSANARHSELMALFYEMRDSRALTIDICHSLLEAFATAQNARGLTEIYATLSKDIRWTPLSAVTYALLVSAFARGGDMKGAIRIYEDCAKVLPPSELTLPQLAMLSAIAETGNSTAAMEFYHSEVVQRRKSVSSPANHEQHTTPNSSSHYSSKGDASTKATGREMSADAQVVDVGESSSSLATVFETLRSKLSESAKYSLAGVQITPSRIVQLFLQAGQVSAAVTVATSILKSDSPITLGTINSVLFALIPSRDTATVMAMVDQMISKHMTPNAVTMNIMMHCLIASDPFMSGPSMALRTFEDICARFQVVPDRQSYVLLLRAFAMLGQLKRCVAVLDRMRQRKMQITAELYGGFLQVCSNTNHVDSLDEIWRCMTKTDNIVPQPYHYQGLLRIHLANGDCNRAVQVMRDAEKAGSSMTKGMAGLFLAALAEHEDPHISDIAFSYLHTFRDSVVVPAPLPAAIFPIIMNNLTKASGQPAQFSPISIAAANNPNIGLPPPPIADRTKRIPATARSQILPLLALAKSGGGAAAAAAVGSDDDDGSGVIMSTVSAISTVAASFAEFYADPTWVTDSLENEQVPAVRVAAIRQAISEIATALFTPMPKASPPPLPPPATPATPLPPATSAPQKQPRSPKSARPPSRRR